MKILDNLSQYRLILGSGSPRRRELMALMGVKYEVIVSDCEEDPVGDTPARMVEELSKQKAEAVLESITRGTDFENTPVIVIGADTVVAINNDILGKPVDRDEGIKMIGVIQGKTHQVYTGVTLAIFKNDEIVYDIFSVKTDVTVNKMTPDEIVSYIDEGEYSDKAGAYGIQGSFSKFVDRITGDYFNVVGLPVSELYNHLKKI